MVSFSYVDVSEQELEDLLRQYVGHLEDGLRYVAHQRFTESGRLDVLLVDSGGSLVLAELKVIEDDSMLFQAIDYYDHVSSHVEAFARMYNTFAIDPTQPVRLFLVAPSFSQSLIIRCKWIDVPITLFSYQCIRLDESKEILPVFSEQTIPSPPEPLEAPYSVQDRLAYVTDPDARARAKGLMDEAVSWDSSRVLVEAIKYAISLKVSGRVFAYISPRRKHFIVETHNNDGIWTGFPVRNLEELDAAKEVMRQNFNRFRR